jgi:hypothetical protein
MPITLDQIVEETREMPAELVAELVDRIMLARPGAGCGGSLETCNRPAHCGD